MLLEALPQFEQFIAAIKGYCAEELETITTSSPCDLCPKKQNCTEPCDRLNRLLGGAYQGKGRRENLAGLFPNTLQEIERVRRQDIFKQYALWKDDFTQYQWPVIELSYNYGLSEEQIGKVLGKSRSTVNGLLKRARKIKEEREKQLRRETREQFKKDKEKDER